MVEIVVVALIFAIPLLLSSLVHDPKAKEHRHRQLIGATGLVLPVALFVIAGIRESDPGLRWAWRSSVSAYYYSGAIALFVGLLVALALFLFAYEGYPDDEHNKWDRRLATIAGVAALGVAFFPTRAPEGMPPLPYYQWWTGWVHGISAAILFLTFAAFAGVLFRLSKPGVEPDRDKKRANAFYLLCAVVIVACIVWAGYGVFTGRSIVWPESIALFAFALSWIVKGKTLGQSRKALQAVADKVLPA